MHEEGHLQSGRPPKLAEHDAVLCWVGLCGDGVAGEGVGFCHLAGQVRSMARTGVAEGIVVVLWVERLLGLITTGYDWLNGIVLVDSCAGVCETCVLLLML